MADLKKFTADLSDMTDQAIRGTDNLRKMLRSAQSKNEFADVIDASKELAQFLSSELRDAQEVLNQVRILPVAGSLTGRVFSNFEAVGLDEDVEKAGVDANEKREVEKRIRRFMGVLEDQKNLVRKHQAEAMDRARNA